MTTPNQSLPATIETLLGIGAFQVDEPGSTNYGQNIDDNFVKNLINGAATELSGAWSDVQAFLAQLETYLKTLPLDALQTLESFIPGTTSGDFSTVNNAVTTIINSLSLQSLRVTIDSFAGLLANSPLNPAKLGENLWPLGMFPPGSVAGSGVWVEDPDVTHSADSTGSVSVTADGTMKALRGIAVTVVAGQQVDLSVFAKWQGYVGTGAPIQLQVAQYSQAAGVIAPAGFATVSTLGPTTPAGDWAEISGTYTAPVDGSVNLIRGRLVVTAAATAGTINFDDATAVNRLIASWVSGLDDALQAMIARFQAIIDTAVQALTGSTTVGNTLADLLFALTNINPDNVGGVLGPGSIGGALIGAVNAIVGGLVGQTGTGAGIADLFNLFKQNSSNATQGSYAWQIQGIRDNTTTSSGFLPSGRANFDLTGSFFKATAPTIAVSQGVSAICIDRVTVSQALGVVSWCGYGNADITGFYVATWGWDAQTSKWDCVDISPNIVSELVAGTDPTDAEFMFYDLDTPVAQVATEDYRYEYIVVGTGTHHMIGETTGSWTPNHPTAKSSVYGFTRSAGVPTLGDSLSDSDFTAANPVPWTEVAINKGDAVGDTYDPEPVYFNEPGTVPIPKWANYVDVIVLGEGGPGASGTLGFYGNPGTPGAYNTTTWARGTHFSGISTVITFAGSAVSVPGYEIDATNGIAGSGTRLALLGKPVGNGPGAHDYNGLVADGGGDQSVLGGAGTTPGGAGNGGYWFGFAIAGGPGGPAAAWVQFRQDALDGETTGSGTGDITAPDAPTLSLIGVTQTTATLTTLSGYPQPTADGLAGVDSPREFGPITVVNFAPHGDADGTVQVPHKVPFTL